jgi:hypothetical protein
MTPVYARDPLAMDRAHFSPTISRRHSLGSSGLAVQRRVNLLEQSFLGKGLLQEGSLVDRHSVSRN